MNIQRSLAEASVYRALALIPEQAAFGLALASSSEKDNPETKRSLELGQKFCDLFLDVITRGATATLPDSEQDAAILFGLKELPIEELSTWNAKIIDVKRTIDALLADQMLPTSEVSRAGQTLRDFAATARRSVSLANEGELLRRAWG